MNRRELVQTSAFSVITALVSQVGHADSKMTTDVPAQLEQRAQRSHGTAFDRIVRGVGVDTCSGPTSSARRCHTRRAV